MQNQNQTQIEFRHEFLAGSRALITGASSGIGLATAQRFANAGAEVVMLAEVEAVNRAARELAARGATATPWVANLARPEEVLGLFERVEEQVGPIDVLVNNAGVGLQASVLQMEPGDLRFLFEVNFFALAALCRDAVRAMAARGRGHIINVSSATARRGLPGMSAYSASKAAVHGFTQALRQEARPLGIHVSEVLPISVRTRFFAAARNRAKQAYAPSGWIQTPERVAEIIAGCLRRPCPEAHTSALARLGLAVAGAFPSLADWFLARRYARQHG
jgi:short-subunit dehydrogenase